jgi:hypothetical protein
MAAFATSWRRQNLRACCALGARPRALATVKLAAPVRHGRALARLARPFGSSTAAGGGVAITRASRRDRTRSIGSCSRARGSTLIFDHPPLGARPRALATVKLAAPVRHGRALARLADGAVLGRIFRANAAPVGTPSRSRAHLQGERRARRNTLDVDIGVWPARGSIANARLCRESPVRRRRVGPGDLAALVVRARRRVRARKHGLARCLEL